jgi:hypothetical protein
MSEVITVETLSRGETSSLLRKLRGCRAYALQLEHGRWLVRSVTDEAAMDSVAVQALIGEWAREEGTQTRAVWVGDVIVPLRVDA